ncbi:HD domain-containing protein [Paenibacillus qinlingensis]|uniref:Hydrolase of HD superfamily n=1 Tax=Paenibacillus qinlingensis TaxID=1837343 RepID=A0ABU1NSK9_9BACL|nr:HD domain-containing protein [Paenibacillus qinlingensis]MDR6550456.1 putative hydrolase of HD superfamily [Paenibacillus qinlingensis]
MITRITQLIDFLSVLDKFKTIERKTYVSNTARRENDAEHTWHMCMFALLLHKEIGYEVNLEKTLKLILIHDLVEIYAGDTFTHDVKARVGKKVREDEAAEILFAQLPEDFKSEFNELWVEYESGETLESQFVKTIDKMQAFAQNVHTKGMVWKENQIAPEKILTYNESWRSHNESFSKIFNHLWSFAKKEGYLYHSDDK